MMYNERMFREMPELNNKESTPEEPQEHTETAIEQEIDTEELFPLKPELQEIVRNYFEEREFEVLEMTDSHVKVKSAQGGKMTIPNKIAIETAVGKSF